MEIVNRLPRWRGFNLPTQKFRAGSAGGFEERDFALLAEWGFDWARLPMSYRAWRREDGGLDEAVLGEIDQGVAFGRRHGVHVNLSVHRVPGRLWKDPAPADQAAAEWATLAERYRGIPSNELSFNLWNEPEEPSPEKMTREDHERVARLVVAAVRQADAQRLILLDGVHWGTKPLYELADLAGIEVHQSCRGYYPCEISHYKAPWNNPDVYPEPDWPLAWSEEQITPRLREWYQTNLSIQLAPGGSDRRKLEAFYDPWLELMGRGVGVHCGEMGCFNRTPHRVAMAWLSDLLDVLRRRRIGFGIWNLYGPFGVLDSERADVAYESFRGHKLDRQMLELLRRS